MTSPFLLQLNQPKPREHHMLETRLLEMTMIFSSWRRFIGFGAPFWARATPLKCNERTDRHGEQSFKHVQILSHAWQPPVLEQT